VKGASASDARRRWGGCRRLGACTRRRGMDARQLPGGRRCYDEARQCCACARVMRGRIWTPSPDVPPTSRQSFRHAASALATMPSTCLAQSPRRAARRDQSQASDALLPLSPICPRMPLQHAPRWSFHFDTRSSRSPSVRGAVRYPASKTGLERHQRHAAEHLHSVREALALFEQRNTNPPGASLNHPGIHRSIPSSTARPSGRCAARSQSKPSPSARAKLSPIMHATPARTKSPHRSLEPSRISRRLVPRANSGQSLSLRACCTHRALRAGYARRCGHVYYKALTRLTGPCDEKERDDRAPTGSGSRP
jgi:hypothetical protein